MGTGAEAPALFRQLKLSYASVEVFAMPIPLLLAAAFALGNATKKEKKKHAVSKHTRKSGARVKAYTRKSK